MVGARNLIWYKISREIGRFWKHFVIIDDEYKLACDTQENIEFILERLNGKAQIVNNVIKFLNSNSWNELKSLGVPDHTSIIMEASKVLVKNNLVHQAQVKCNRILQDNELFMNAYKELVNLRL